MNINYKNTTISYQVKGKGTALVFLHGFLEYKEMWKPLIAHFSKKYKVITIDLLGHGNSGSLGYIHTMEEQATVVKEVLKSLRIRRCFLVGHSMGGYVALSFASLFPENVKGISLMNSTALPDTEEKKKNRDRGIISVKKNHHLFIKVAIPMLFSEENKKEYQKEIEKVIQQALKTPLQGIVAALEGMKIRKDLSELYHSDDFSTQLIIGKKDPALDYSSLQKQVKGTNAEVIEFDGGHMSHIENTSSLIEVLQLFFKKNA